MLLYKNGLLNFILFNKATLSTTTLLLPSNNIFYLSSVFFLKYLNFNCIHSFNVAVIVKGSKEKWIVDVSAYYSLFSSEAREAREQPPTAAVVSLSERRDSAHFLSNKTSNSRNIAFMKRIVTVDILIRKPCTTMNDPTKQ